MQQQEQEWGGKDEGMEGRRDATDRLKTAKPDRRSWFPCSSSLFISRPTLSHPKTPRTVAGFTPMLKKGACPVKTDK